MPKLPRRAALIVNNKSRKGQEAYRDACRLLKQAGVELTIARAIEDPATPLRVPVGPDAELILGMRRSLDDQAFEGAMRKAVGLTW